MKKNDFATFIVYLGMFGIAIGVGLGILRNKIAGSSLPVNAFVIIAISVLVSILFNAIILELGHLCGAKVGKYKVKSVAILGLTFRRENGKRKASFKAYEGLTGQTKIVPLDPKTSTPSSFVLFPVLFLLVEVIGIVVAIVFAKQSTSLLWLEIACDTFLCVAAMLYFYDLFPARLDSVTDGYLMMLVGKPVNRLAYNQMLLAEDRLESGLEPLEMPVYDDVTDFTAVLNSINAYKLIKEGKYTEAIKILDLIIDTERHITESTRNEAYALKLSLLFLTKNHQEVKEFYDAIEDDRRKYIADLYSASCLRDYMLISALLDDSFTETRYAYLKKPNIDKHTPEGEKEVSEILYGKSMQLIKEVHPTWDLEKEEQ